jgi:predicted dehydrogenase
MEKIKVAVIGCGGFARGMHLPNMRGNDKYELYAACDIDEGLARKTAKDFEMKYATPDYEKILKDKEVDLVLITTRHNLHAEQTIKAAQAGKHILCEKPMALNIEDCYRVMKEVKKAKVKYTVGYNRGLAPLITKARDILKATDSPLVIYHRMANSFPSHHWLLDEKEGGGRVVGEGCHILDLFSVLASSQANRIYAEGGIFSYGNVPDTQVATLSFENGSVATMLLSSVGNNRLPKESTEIFSGTLSILITDFKEMKIYGEKEPESEEAITLPVQDRGHKREIELLAEAILRNKEPPNGLENACQGALLSFKVLEAIKTKQVQEIKPEEYRIT